MRRTHRSNEPMVSLEQPDSSGSEAIALVGVVPSTLRLRLLLTKTWTCRSRHEITLMVDSRPHSEAHATSPLASCGSHAAAGTGVGWVGSRCCTKGVAMPTNSAKKALAKAKKDLAVIDRQVQVYSLFGSELRSVLEITKKP